MNLIALAAAGLPPYGTGCYTRNTVDLARIPNVRWYAVNAERDDHEAQAHSLMSAGKEVWLFTGPEATRHYNWRAGLAYLVERVRSVGAKGLIVNPERNRNTGGWMISDVASEMERFGAACGEAAQDTRVGMVSYPAMPGVARFFAAAGDRVWGSVEIYGHDEPTAEAMARYYRQWESYVGSTRLIPSISGWSGANQGTAELYNAYLSRLPKASGAAAWLGTGTVPIHIRRGLEAYDAGGSALGTWVRWLGALLGRPAGAALAGIAIAVLAFVFVSIGVFV